LYICTKHKEKENIFNTCFNPQLGAFMLILHYKIIYTKFGKYQTEKEDKFSFENAYLVKSIFWKQKARHNYNLWIGYGQNIS